MKVDGPHVFESALTCAPAAVPRPAVTLSDPSQQLFANANVICLHTQSSKNL